MYQLNQENIEKLVNALDYYIEKVSDLEDYEVAKQNILITDNILKILERYSGNNDNTLTYTSDGR